MCGNQFATIQNAVAEKIRAPSYYSLSNHHHLELPTPFLLTLTDIPLHYGTVSVNSSPTSQIRYSPALDSEAENTIDMSLETAVEQAKRAFALQKYEQAVDLYTVALEKLYVFRSLASRRASNCVFMPASVILRTAEVKDDAPELADLYFLYGKALLENAISQAGVLGKDQPAGAEEDEEGESCHTSSGDEPLT